MASFQFRHIFSLISVLTFSTLLLAGNAAAKDCLECHIDIVSQFSSNSHHIQGKPLSARQCYSCHWEAAPDGSIDKRHHQQDHAMVDLVVWEKSDRPSEYVAGSTAVVFSAVDMGTTAERTAVAKVTLHCLGCHSDGNNDTIPFGDGKTPRHYAWDRQSIASRYQDKGITTWGKYSSSATNKKKRINKALSAHGNAAANQGGWSSANGYDGDMPLTRGGEQAKNIECLDCHNSHGSSAKGTTASYQTFDNSFNGGMLKQTMAGKGGYKTDYTPSSNEASQANNPFSTGAGLCFDCHETASAGAAPWGYNTTFGAKEPIMGYKDTLRFGSGSKGSTARFSDRQNRSIIASSHLKAGRLLNYSAHGAIRGLCTPCHDPHGVSRTLEGNMPYAVPLLKGTWLTSPYREDGPPSKGQQKAGAPKAEGTADRGIAWEKGDFSFTNREANANFGISGGGAPREPMSRSGMKYNVDRNTFGANSRITESDDRFAGLCLKCHSKVNLTDNSKTGQIHRTVKGWGNNKEHSFPCSKCHQAHNSGLPRLMQTNCFEVGPPGLRDSSGLAWSPDRKGAQKSTEKSDPKSPSKSKKSGKVEIVGCHVRQFGGNPAKQQGSQWNEKTKW